MSRDLSAHPGSVNVLWGKITGPFRSVLPFPCCFRHWGISPLPIFYSSKLCRLKQELRVRWDSMYSSRPSPGCFCFLLCGCRSLIVMLKNQTRHMDSNSHRIVSGGFLILCFGLGFIEPAYQTVFGSLLDSRGRQHLFCFPYYNIGCFHLAGPLQIKNGKNILRWD